MPVPYVKQTWTDGSGGGTPLSAARFGVMEQGIYDAHRQPTARAYNSASIALTTAVATVITLNSERYDTDTIHDTSTNTGRLTAKTAGVYSIVGRVVFAANATGSRQLDLRLNGTTVIDTDLEATPSGTLGTYLKVAAQYQFAINDYVELVATQTSGGNLNVNSSGNYSPEFEMTRIST